MFKKSFLSLLDFSPTELERVLKLAKILKERRRSAPKILAGTTLAMIFQKPSMRTRFSFEIGIRELGGDAVVVQPNEIQMGVRESVSDVARVLSRYVDAVMMRVLRHTDIEEFSKFSQVPVINGLSDLFHPCQALSDIFTIIEHKKKAEGLSLVYLGDGNNVANSLIHAANKFKLSISICCPEGYEPSVSQADSRYSIVRDPAEALSGADVVYTDVWTSMGQEEERFERLRAFEGYTISEELMSRTAKDALFMHCLPAHRGEEVDHEVMEGSKSVVFDQAENRLHVQKALLALLLHPNPESELIS